MGKHFARYLIQNQYFFDGVPPSMTSDFRLPAITPEFVDKVRANFIEKCPIRARIKAVLCIRLGRVKHYSPSYKIPTYEVSVPEWGYTWSQDCSNAQEWIMVEVGVGLFRNWTVWIYYDGNC